MKVLHNAELVGFDVKMTVKSSDTLPPLPSDNAGESGEHIEADTVATALHVLHTERGALDNLSRIYAHDVPARQNLSSAISLIARTASSDGRVIISGIGKSGKIAEKFVATLNSLSIRAAFLHPVEAVHGDLGMVGPRDCVVVITFSGRTPELRSLVPLLPPGTAKVLIVGQRRAEDCGIIDDPQSARYGSIDWLFLPAPIPIAERHSFSVEAPTTSTSVALALCNALALTAARVVHQDSGEVFRQNHPGGAIGSAVGKGG